MSGTECGSDALLLDVSAEGVFGAVIARRDRQRDRINLSESGSCRNEALERHSEALHIGRCGGVPCGTREMFRTYASSRALSIAIRTSPIAYLPTQAERRRGQRPQAVRNARSECSGER
jgi:hypothetical protein